MTAFVNALVATMAVSAASLVGLALISLREKMLRPMLLLLVSLSAGTLMGGAFFHLVPESLELIGTDTTMLLLSVSFAGFYILEHVLHWRHCHEGQCKDHAFGYLNLVGDALHNFLDGMVIAGAFQVDVRVGWITALAIVLHELPQEIGDFGVLLHAGFARSQALLANFFVALTAMLGAVSGFYLIEQVPGLEGWLLPIAAGGFLYIASSDLLPEVRAKTNGHSSTAAFGVFLAGVAILYAASLLE